MSPKPLVSAFLLAGALSCAAPMHATTRAPRVAQQGSGALVGKVVDEATGAPIDDAVISIKSVALREEPVAVTNSAGEWRFDGLAPSKYSVMIEKEQYRPQLKGDLVVSAEHETSTSARLQKEILARSPGEAEPVTIELDGYFLPSTAPFQNVTIECPACPIPRVSY